MRRREPSGGSVISGDTMRAGTGDPPAGAGDRLDVCQQARHDERDRGRLPGGLARAECEVERGRFPSVAHPTSSQSRKRTRRISLPVGGTSSQPSRRARVASSVRERSRVARRCGRGGSPRSSTPIPRAAPISSLLRPSTTRATTSRSRRVRRTAPTDVGRTENANRRLRHAGPRREARTAAPSSPQTPRHPGAAPPPRTAGSHRRSGRRPRSCAAPRRSASTVQPAPRRRVEGRAGARRPMPRVESGRARLVEGRRDTDDLDVGLAARRDAIPSATTGWSSTIRRGYGGRPMRIRRPASRARRACHRPASAAHRGSRRSPRPVAAC